MKPSRIFIVAGEASADMHAAELLAELRKNHPGIEVYGVGGSALKAQGVELIVDSSALSVVGLTDWVSKIREVYRAYRTVTKAIDRRGGDLAILLDLPDFNLVIARRLKRRGIPVVYYISPQVWAWRKYRIRTIKKTVQKMLVLFPFEKDFYLRHGCDATFVGNPLVETVLPRAGHRDAERILAPRFALLPGSRSSEIRFHAPILNRVVARLKARYPNATFRLPIASTLKEEFVRQFFDPKVISLEREASRDILAWADTAIVGSGTATLETALVGTPFCLFYRLSFTSAFFYQHIARYRGFLGMPNLLFGREVAKEFFQEKADPELIFQETVRLLEDVAHRNAQISTWGQLRNLLGDRNASKLAAEQVSEVLNASIPRSGSVLGLDHAPSNP